MTIQSAIAKLRDAREKATQQPFSVLDSRAVGHERLTIATETAGVIARIENLVTDKPLDEEDVANASFIAISANVWGKMLDVIEAAGNLVQKPKLERCKQLAEVLESLRKAVEGE